MPLSLQLRLNRGALQPAVTSGGNDAAQLVTRYRDASQLAAFALQLSICKGALPSFAMSRKNCSDAAAA